LSAVKSNLTAGLRVTSRRGDLAPLSVPPLPAWLLDLFASAESRLEVTNLEALGVRANVKSLSIPGASLISVAVPDADGLDDQGFSHASESAYGLLRDALSCGDTPCPVRFWNFIPGIARPAGGGLNRYMWFNLGRHAGLRAWRWSGANREFTGSLPTATGVGHASGELVVHALALRSAGCAMENPRQRPAYLYSQNFGPLPPCFSRGTIVDAFENSRLLIGGTASVIGEESLHAGSFVGQFEETLENLRTLLRTATAGGDHPLERITHARVYCTRPSDLAPAKRRLSQTLRRGVPVEAVRADLCRPELLVEIEAVAEIGGTLGHGHTQ